MKAADVVRVKFQIVLNLAALMGTMMARLSFCETLILNAIRARAVNGVAAATDRALANETALSISEARDTRRGLAARGAFECSVAFAGRVEADDELAIVLIAAEKAAVP